MPTSQSALQKLKKKEVQSFGTVALPCLDKQSQQWPAAHRAVPSTVRPCIKAMLTGIYGSAGWLANCAVEHWTNSCAYSSARRDILYRRMEYYLWTAPTGMCGCQRGCTASQPLPCWCAGPGPACRLSLMIWTLSGAGTAYGRLSWTCPSLLCWYACSHKGNPPGLLGALLGDLLITPNMIA